MRPLEQKLTEIAAGINAMQERQALLTGNEARMLGAELHALRESLGADCLERALRNLLALPRQATRLLLIAQVMQTAAGVAVLGETVGLSKLAALANLDESELQVLAAGQCLRGLSLADLRAMSPRQLGNALATVTADERTLLVRYRRCTEQAKRHVQQAAQLLAEQR